MKVKKLICIVLSIAIVLVIAYLIVCFALKWKYYSAFDFLYPTELQFYDYREKISYASVEGNRTAFLTEKGDVYISGNSQESIGIPLKERKAQNHYSKFVKIFENAQKVNLGKSGGVILDNQNQLYVFSRAIEGYELPTKIEATDISKINDAYIYYSALFVTTEFGELYHIDMKNQKVKSLLLDGVKEINCEDSRYINVVNQTGDAIRIDMLTPQQDGEIVFTEVIDFAIYNKDVYGYINEFGNAYVKYNGIAEEKLVIENAVQITPYYQGIAIQDSNGNVWYFGRDVLLNKFYDGEKIASGAELLISASIEDSLCILDKNGCLYFYGSAGYGAWGQGPRGDIRRFSEQPYCVNPTDGGVS